MLNYYKWLVITPANPGDLIRRYTTYPRKSPHSLLGLLEECDQTRRVENVYNVHAMIPQTECVQPDTNHNVPTKTLVNNVPPRYAIVTVNFLFIARSGNIL